MCVVCAKLNLICCAYALTPIFKELEILSPDTLI